MWCAVSVINYRMRRRGNRREQVRQRSREAVARRMANAAPDQEPYRIYCHPHEQDLAWELTEALRIARRLVRLHRRNVLVMHENGFSQVVEPVTIHRTFLQKVNWKKEGF
jgi:hypothetical protein